MSEQEKIEQEIAELEEQLATLKNPAVIRAIETSLNLLNQKLAEFNPSKASITTQDVGGSLNVDSELKAGGDIVGRDKTENHITILTEQSASAFRAAFWDQQTPTDLTQATQAYFRYLANRYQNLDFKGMGVSDRMPLRLPLAQMYVPLKARIEMPHGETWERDDKALRLAGREMSEAELADIGHRLSEPRPVLDLLQQRRGLIVLGDPGAGKTTFLKYLALKLVLGEGAELGLDHRLPILLPLSAYANAISEKDVSLGRFIGQYYQDTIDLDHPFPLMLKAALRQGGALLLLDGLDEVQAVSQRNLVIKRVLDFCMAQPEGNLFVLTSRIVGYREVRPTAANIAECTLTDFDEAEIEDFVSKWTLAIEQQALNDPHLAKREAAREQAELMQSVRHNKGVRQLAANPLLLTILAVMKRQGVVLPERRVQLYETYVETLLSHWNVARGLGRAVEHDLDVVETLKVLAPLALWMHYTNPGFGLVKEQELFRQLEAIYRLRHHESPHRATQRFLADVREYASLLLERGTGQYGFIHLTFQEYLAGVAVVQKGQDGIAPIVEELAQHLGDDSWHEVSLLAIGHLGINQQREIAASNVLEQLIAQHPQPQAVLLAGEAVADVWPNGVTAQCRERVQGALLATIRDMTVPAKKRARAGQVLARVGDPRPEVMTIEGMRFCYVPAGEFHMGEGKESHLVPMPYDYWLGQYPVTNAQFEAFVEAGGYEQERYWREAKGLGYWQVGQGFRNEKRPLSLRHPFPLSNHPVVGVSWYESLSFCRWLTEQLPEGWLARLPTEAEWEKGARGGLQIPSEAVVMAVDSVTSARFDPFGKLRAGPLSAPAVQLMSNEHPQRRYVWGDESPNGEQINFEATDIGATNAVGCFPYDLSVYGCAEMSGNVNEWVQTKWGYEYPYQSEDGRETIDASNKSRVLRGGHWYWDASWARCSFRYWSYPGSWYDGDDGFRVIVLSPFPVSKGSVASA